MFIAIPTSVSKTQYYINQAYYDYVSGAGMEPILVAQSADIEAIADLCDGLLLPGGVDIDPTFYNETNGASYSVDPSKDEFERDMLYSFIKAGKPIFGICRGFQLIAREYLWANPNKEEWLEYYQHLGGHSLADSLSIPRTAFSHKVYYWPELYGKKRKRKRRVMFVNSMHHQALLTENKEGSEGADFEILAVTTEGITKKMGGYYVIEAYRINNKHARIQAVQWHPEELKDYRLIQAFFGVEMYEEEPNKGLRPGWFGRTYAKGKKRVVAG